MSFAALILRGSGAEARNLPQFNRNFFSDASVQKFNFFLEEIFFTPTVINRPTVTT